jgi:aminopeptidase 2
MMANWSALEKKLPPGLTMLGSVVSICTSAFTKQEHIDQISKFFGERSTKGFDQSLAQSLDAIKAKSQWIERDAKDVEGWLKDNGYLG